MIFFIDCNSKINIFYGLKIYKFTKFSYICAKLVIKTFTLWKN